MNLRQKNGKKEAAFNDLPSGYFEQLPERLTDRLAREEKRLRLRPVRISAAAAVALLLGSGLLWLSVPKQEINSGLAFWQQKGDSLKLKKLPVTADTLLHSKTLSTKTLPTADSLDRMLDALALDEILLYLNETEEFEF